MSLYSDVELLNTIDYTRRVISDNVAPQVISGLSVAPKPSAFKILSASVSSGVLTAVFGWAHPEDRPHLISGYNILAQNIAVPGSAMSIGNVVGSPARIMMLVPTTYNYVFYLQTTLNNGDNTPLAECPTVTLSS